MIKKRAREYLALRILNMRHIMPLHRAAHQPFLPQSNQGKDFSVMLTRSIPGVCLIHDIGFAAKVC